MTNAHLYIGIGQDYMRQTGESGTEKDRLELDVMIEMASRFVEKIRASGMARANGLRIKADITKAMLKAIGSEIDDRRKQ